jgi:DNA polymerase/3'-5' exonuclease PolX
MASASNQKIADKLRELVDLLEQQGANPFRVGAYRRAAETAAAHKEELTCAWRIPIMSTNRPYFIGL